MSERELVALMAAVIYTAFPPEYPRGPQIAVATAKEILGLIEKPGPDRSGPR